MYCGNVLNSLNKSLTSETDEQDFDDFLDRIQTYIDGQPWAKKDISLSPAVCSQYGWKCMKRDLLECATCHARLFVYDFKLDYFGSYKSYNEGILKNLKDSHGKHCPWPHTPCPENFIKMTPMLKEEAMSQFLKRMESSLAFQSYLPEIKESVLTDLGFSEQQILSVCKMVGIKPEDACQFGKSIVPLSATGWIITETDESDRAIYFDCNNCLRSVWSGLFCLLNSDSVQNKTKELNATDSLVGIHCVSENGTCEKSLNNEKNSGEPPRRRKRVSVCIEKEPFDPVYNHRPWCLWIRNGVDCYVSSSSNDELDEDLKKESNLPGWKIFIKTLLRNISHNQTSEDTECVSKVEIRNARSSIETWLE